MLALRANRTVSADSLIDGLWGERPPESAAKNVQTHVSRLRKALAADGSEASIVTHGRGYELQLSEEAVDAVRFERLVERARRDADQGIADGAAKEALKLWQGAPLADVASEPFAGPEIRRLEELHVRALELGIDAELAAGRHGEVIGRLEALIAEHPLNERFHAQRMLALYRSGRRSEALEAYRQARRSLTDGLGIEPGSELRRLQEQILAQDPALDAPAPSAELAPQLEGGSPLLAGRERELGWLRERWDETRSGGSTVALVSGPAGIGKTRLVAELAREVHRGGASVIYAAGSGAAEAALDAVRRAGESERPDAPRHRRRRRCSARGARGRGGSRRETARAAPAHPRAAPGRTQPTGAGGTRARRRIASPGARAPGSRRGRGDRRPVRARRRPRDPDRAPDRRERRGAARAAPRGQRRGLKRRRAGDWRQRPTGRRASAATSARRRRSWPGSVADLQAARERGDLYLVEPADPSAPEVCPFRGLAPFDAVHAAYFFGRERLVAGLVARVVGSTLLAVVGPSGSGKSSVLRAGLLPALANGMLPGSQRWRQVLIRPGEHPLAASAARPRAPCARRGPGRRC